MIENREPLAATATRWELTPAYVRQFCKDGRIPGAVKVGRDWWIPSDAVRPQMRKYGEVKAMRDAMESDARQDAQEDHAAMVEAQGAGREADI